MITRLATPKEAAAALKRYQVRAEKNGWSMTPRYPILREGDSLDKELPTLYFTTLEVIFMTKLLGCVANYHDQLGLKFALIQGIHDGLLFAFEDSLDTNDLLQKFNEMLYREGLESIGMGLQATLHHCSSPDWVLAESPLQSELDI